MKKIKNLTFSPKKGKKGNWSTHVWETKNGKKDVLGLSTEEDKYIGFLPIKVKAKAFKKLGITQVEFGVTDTFEGEYGEVHKLHIHKHNGSKKDSKEPSS